jgi:large subunit ribosomal protein L15
MAYQLHTIKNEANTKHRKRLGRGNASGKGTYCGKGLKGQKCRSGVSGLKKLGMRQTLMRIPKKKGFQSLKPKPETVNLSDINRHFKNNETVSPQTLFSKELINTPKNIVKILGKGKLVLTGLKFEKVEMSESVKKQLGYSQK